MPIRTMAELEKELLKLREAILNDAEETIRRKASSKDAFYYVLDSGIQCEECGCRIFKYVIDKPKDLQCARCDTIPPTAEVEKALNEWELRVASVSGTRSEITRLFKEVPFGNQ